MSVIRVLIADDHPVVREGLRGLIDSEPGMAVVGEAADGQEAVEKAAALAPDVVLLDLMMPRKDGIAAIGELLRNNRRARILVLTSFAEDEKVLRAVKEGALGYLLKDSSPQELLAAIREVAAGGSPMNSIVARKLIRGLHKPEADQPAEEQLTAREREVLILLAQGLSNQEIADSLVVSERTVRCHVSSVLHKLRLASRTQAALFAIREGIVGVGQPDSSAAPGRSLAAASRPRPQGCTA